MHYLLLCLTAAIWGFAFVAQRVGMQSLDPFSFNAIRFALGAMVVLILGKTWNQKPVSFPWLPGLVLFIAASLQQVGMMFTTAGAGGFITGLYVVIVPLIGLLHRQYIRRQDYVAAIIAVAGMLLINQPAGLEGTLGNVLVLVSAFFWAWHVQLIDSYGKQYSTFSLAFSQFAVVAALSAVAALLWYWFLYASVHGMARLGAGIWQAKWPLAYGGILSVGVAYTLQIKAQKGVAPVPASVILCAEGMFAFVGGLVLLHEQVNLMAGIGMGLMLMAMLLAVLPNFLIDRMRGS